MDFILFATANGIATITLNRPEKRNALNGQMIQELSKALKKAQEDADIRMVLLHANGEHFCAGADIGWMQNIATMTEDENYDDAQHLADLMYQLYELPKPTIVLAQGATLGGGLGLLAACDIAISTKDASFAFSEVKIGIAPSVVSPYVIAAIGERAAHYYFLTGERFGADVAERIGLIHQHTEKEALLSTGMSIAQQLMENSPRAMTEAKKVIRFVAREKISERVSQLTAEHLAELRATTEAQEGLKAFLEKRKPIWIVKR